MADNDSMIKLTAALEKEKSTKQINQDIKALEKTISQLHLMAVLDKGESKNELNTSIEELEKKVKAIKLKTTVDVRSIRKEIDSALQNVTLKDIKINNLGMKLAAQKVAQNITDTLERYVVLPKIELKHDQFHMDFSGILKNLAMVTAGFDLAVSGIIKFRKSMNTSREITSLFNEISELSGIATEDVQKLSEASLQAAGNYGKSIKEYLEGVLAVLKNGQATISGQEEQLVQVFQSMDSLFANSTITWENRLISMQNAWDSFVYSLMNADSSGSSFLFQTILSVKTLYQYLDQIPKMITEFSSSPALTATLDVRTTTKSEDSFDKKAQAAINPFDWKSLKGSASDFKDISKSVGELEEKLITGGDGLNSFYSFIAKNDQVLQDYLATCSNDAPASLAGYQSYLNNAGVQTDLLKVKTILLNGALSAVSAIGMQLVTMTLASLGQAIYDQIHQSEIASEAAVKAQKKLTDIQTDIDTLNSKLKTTSDRINELSSKDSLKLVEQEELDKLSVTNKELRRQIEYKKALESMAGEESNKKALYYFNTSANYKKYSGLHEQNILNTNYTYKSPTMDSKDGNPLEKINSEMADYKKLMELKQTVKKQIDEIVNSGQNISDFNPKYDALQLEYNDIDLQLNKFKKSIPETADLIKQSRAGLDPLKDKDLINNINNTIDSFSQQFGSRSALPLKVSLDLQTDKNQIHDLIKKAASDNLSTLDIKANLLVESDKTPQEFIDALLTEFEEEINQQKEDNFKIALSGLSAGTLEEYINFLNTGDLNKESISSFEGLNKIMKETGVNAEDAFNNLKEFSKDYVTSSDLTSGMENAAQLIGSVKQEFADTRKVGSSSLNAISKNFPQLSSAVLEYSQDAIDYDNLIKQLEDAYADDSEAYRLNIVYKLQFDENFFSTVRDRNQQLFKNLAEAYGDDLRNWNNLVQAKSGINNGFKNKLYDILDHSDTETATPDKLYNQYINVNKDNTLSVNEKMRDELSNDEKQALDNEVSKYNENQKKIK